ncbi:BA14K family protein [Methylobacterium sp. NFXW15]
MAVYEPALVYARPVAVGGSGYCAARFASYDPASGTYLGCDGFRHPRL